CQLSGILSCREPGRLDLGGKLCGRCSGHEPQCLSLTSEWSRDIKRDLVAVELNIVQPPAMSARIVKKGDKYGLFVNGQLELAARKRKVFSALPDEQPFARDR